MRLLRLGAGLPLMPLRGVLGLAGIVRDEASRELHDPAAIQRRLADISEARDAGLLSADEAARMEYDAFRLLIWQEDT
jgi:hypothetical protein